MEIGLHLWPWHPMKELLGYAQEAHRQFPFDHIWLVDAMQYEDTLTAMTAMAMNLDVSLGTMVTFPRRNPMELAQRFSSLSHLMPSGREVVAGLGSGGRLQESVLAEGTSPEKVPVVKETVSFLRKMFAGESVALAQFPELVSRFNYNREAKARLYFPPDRPLPVYLAAGGPKMFQVAAREADGVILTQINPWTSLVGMRAGRFRQAIETVELTLKLSGNQQRFKKIYSAKISVSQDGGAAKQWAKRQVSYGAATYPTALKRLGCDPDEIERIKSAYIQGLGIEEAASRVSDRLAEELGFVTAGTPEECTAGYHEILDHLEGLGFDHLVMGVPLGPNVPEALQLITKRILPALKGRLENF